MMKVKTSNVKPDGLRGLRRRIFFHQWTGKTTVDYVCNKCMTIVPVPEGGCTRCATRKEKKAENLQKFLDSRKGEQP